jgi:type II secretory pathway pseudopilin PulG
MRRNGFTVLEVVIVALFFTLVIWGGGATYDWYIRSSRADAAAQFIEQLAEAEQRFYKSNGRYLPLAQNEADAYPKKISAEGTLFGTGPAFFEKLGVPLPKDPVFFRVAVLAGAEDGPPREGWLSGAEEFITDAPAPPPEPWFWIVAFADQDGDGKMAVLSISSWKREIQQRDRTE